MSGTTQIRSVPPPQSGLVAGKYELLQLIGRGGMGSVWEARHVSLERRVAIKFIEKEYADSKEARSRFDNEARAAAKIRSKHLIEIYDHGLTDEGKPYIVMELLEGEPLDKRLEGRTRLPLQEVARILSQCARGLQRAHEQQIIHRDLKPENIFLVRSQDEDEEVAKVLDFGIAKIRDPNGQALSNSTKTGAVLGTPYYMSPEQARGLRDVDHRTDLWSLGVIVFKCVTGVLPFEGESLGDLLVKICTAPLPVPSQVLQGLPPGFDAWFARALDRDPNRRFSTAIEMADALAAVAGVSFRRPPTSSATSELDGARPDRSGAVSAASYGASSSAQTPIAVPNVTATGLATSAQDAGAPQIKSAPIGMILGGALVLLGIFLVGAFFLYSKAPDRKAAGTSHAAQQAPTASTTTPSEIVTAPPLASIPTASSGSVAASPNAAPSSEPSAPPTGKHPGKKPTEHTGTGSSGSNGSTSGTGVVAKPKETPPPPASTAKPGHDLGPGF